MSEDEISERVVEACKQANAHDFITEFPDQYDTVCGEKGMQLSGGQKQRVAIARALIKQPKILLLDEATSALDSESESIVQKSIDEIIRTTNITCVIVAHRLSTIRHVDCIYVLEDGKILKKGTHDKLIEIEDGRYSSMIEMETLISE